MVFGCVQPAKGFSRLSIIFFGLLYSYHVLQKSWTDDPDSELDFKRCLAPNSCIAWCVAYTDTHETERLSCQVPQNRCYASGQGVKTRLT